MCCMNPRSSSPSSSSFHIPVPVTPSPCFALCLPLSSSTTTRFVPSTSTFSFSPLCCLSAFLALRRNDSTKSPATTCFVCSSKLSKLKPWPWPWWFNFEGDDFCWPPKVLFRGDDHDSCQSTIFKEYLTKSVGPGQFSAELLKVIPLTDW